MTRRADSSQASSGAVPPRRAALWLLLGGGVLGLLGAGAATAWRLMPTRSDYFTDAGEIRAPARDTAPRDVLWRPPRPLSEIINTGGEVYEPRVAWDGLTVFFVRGKAGGHADLYVSTRSAAGWSAPQALDEVNTPDADELGPEPSADGQSLYFYSDRTGGQGGYDLWVARRGESGWQAATNLGPQVNSGFNEYGPAVAPDGATLYFASNRPRPDDAEQPDAHAWPATIREDVYRRSYDLFASQLGESGAAPPVLLGVLNSSGNDGAPCVSPAGDFLYFASDRSGGRGGYDLYRSRVIGGAPQPPEALDASINTPANELDPGLSQLGYALYFSSDRAPPGATPGVAAPRAYAVYYTDAREVFRKVEYAPGAAIDWSAVATSLLWLLAALALLALVLVFLGKVRDKRLTLLTRCLFGSLLLHSLLMFLFSFWRVTTGLVESLHGSGQVQVALLPFDGTGELSLQLNGQVVDVAAPEAVEIVVARPEHALPVMGEILHESSVAPREFEAEPVDTRTAAADAAPGAGPQLEISTITPAEAARRDLALPAAQAQARRDESESALPPLEEPRVVARPEIAGASPSLRMHAAPSTARPTQPRESALATELRNEHFTTEAQPNVAIGPPIAAPAPPSASTVAKTALPPDAAPAAAARVAEPGGAPVTGPLRELARVAPQVSAAAPAALREVQSSGRGVRLASDEQIVRRASPTESSGAAHVASLLPAQAAGTTQLAKASPQIALPRLEEAATEGGAAKEQSPTVPSAAHAAPARDRSLLPLPPAPPGGAQLAAPASETAARRAVNERSRTAEPAATTARESDRRSTPSPLLPAAGLAPLQSSASTLRVPTDVARPQPAAAIAAKSPLPARIAADPARAGAIRAALDWLVRHQSEDGHWSARDFDQSCRGCGGPGADQFDVGVTGLAVLSFLGAEQSADRPGPYQDTVRRAVAWLIGRAGDDGDLARGETLYSQALGTFALAEAHALSASPECARAARAGAERILALRETGGVWRALEGAPPDTAVLGWQILALRAAEGAGLAAPREAYQSALVWFERVSDRRRPGLFAFRPGDAAAVSMTAEGLHTLQLLGIPDDDPRVAGGLELLLANRPVWSESANTYAWYFAARGLARVGGDGWEPWRGALARALLESQSKDGASAGSWMPTGDWSALGGRVFQTALCTLMLETAAGAEQLAYRPIGVIRGVVRDSSSSEPIAGASVRLELPDAPAVLSESGRDGRYELLVPDVPEFFAIAAAHPEYAPASENVAAADLRGRVHQLDLRLDPKATNVVSLEEFPQVHHLGNDRWEGRINSKFQKRSEGLLYRATFSLSAAQLADRGPRAALTLLARGVQCPHEVVINGTLLDRHIDHSPGDGSFGPVRVAFDAGLLRAGENTLEIRDVECTGDWDDFEFINLQVRLGR